MQGNIITAMESVHLRKWVDKAVRKIQLVPPLRLHTNLNFQENAPRSFLKKVSFKYLNHAASMMAEEKKKRRNEWITVLCGVLQFG